MGKHRARKGAAQLSGTSKFVRFTWTPSDMILFLTVINILVHWSPHTQIVLLSFFTLGISECFRLADQWSVKLSWILSQQAIKYLPHHFLYTNISFLEQIPVVWEDNFREWPIYKILWVKTGKCFPQRGKRFGRAQWKVLTTCYIEHSIKQKFNTWKKGEIISSTCPCFVLL